MSNLRKLQVHPTVACVFNRVELGVCRGRYDSLPDTASLAADSRRGTMRSPPPSLCVWGPLFVPSTIYRAADGTYRGHFTPRLVQRLGSHLKSSLFRAWQGGEVAAASPLSGQRYCKLWTDCVGSVAKRGLVGASTLFSPASASS